MKRSTLKLYLFAPALGGVFMALYQGAMWPKELAGQSFPLMAFVAAFSFGFVLVFIANGLIDLLVKEK